MSGGEVKADTRKCFARRYRPSTLMGALKFDALRKAFQEVIRPKLTYATKHEARHDTSRGRD